MSPSARFIIDPGGLGLAYESLGWRSLVARAEPASTGTEKTHVGRYTVTKTPERKRQIVKKRAALFLAPDTLKLLRALFDSHELAALLVALELDVFVSGFFNWVRFFTAPLRALSPVGLFTAMGASDRGIGVFARASYSPPGRNLINYLGSDTAGINSSALRMGGPRTNLVLPLPTRTSRREPVRFFLRSRETASRRASGGSLIRS